MCPSKTRSWSSISSYQGLHLSQAPFSCESIHGLIHGLDQDPPQGSTNQRKGHWGRVQYLIKIQPGTGMMAQRVRENVVHVWGAEFKYSAYVRDWAWPCVPLVTETAGLLGLAGPSPTSRLNEETLGRMSESDRAVHPKSSSGLQACTRTHTHHMHNFSATIGISHIMRISNWAFFQ